MISETATPGLFWVFRWLYTGRVLVENRELLVTVKIQIFNQVYLRSPELTENSQWSSSFFNKNDGVYDDIPNRTEGLKRSHKTEKVQDDKKSNLDQEFNQPRELLQIHLISTTVLGGNKKNKRYQRKTKEKWHIILTNQFDYYKQGLTVYMVRVLDSSFKPNV